MKYGIVQQLRAEDVDAAQRFHAAMLVRLHQLQLGAEVDLGSPVDVALTMLALWSKAPPPPGASAVLRHRRSG